MVGYSEVIQTMAAIIIFSIILMNANSMIHRNTMIQISGEFEQEIISIGQEIIEEARSKSFDNVTVDAVAPPAIIPGGFTAPSNLGPDAGEFARVDFDDFDDYDGYGCAVDAPPITTSHGDFNICVSVYYVDYPGFNKINTQSTFKKIEIDIQSEFIRDGSEPRTYTLEFIRNYYAD